MIRIDKRWLLKDNNFESKLVIAIISKGNIFDSIETLNQLWDNYELYELKYSLQLRLHVNRL